MKAEISSSTIDVTITLKITEQQARALDKFAYFGAYEQTTKFIHEKWGNDIKWNHLKDFFVRAHEELNPHLQKIDEDRKIFDVVKKKI